MQRTVPKAGEIGVYLASQPLVTVFGVKYLHLRMPDGSDLYVTEYGMPFTKCLLPENHWADKAWMAAHGTRLPGTSALYRVTTKEVEGRSKEIVIKWNRMGQDIPGATATGDLDGAEFNSPFMEVSLLLELRQTRHESPGQLYTHRPLAIYVPRKFVEGERLGRRRHKMEAIQRRHDEIALDWNRNYALIYEWMKGIDALEACQRGLIDAPAMARLVERAGEDLRRKGFVVRDNKPQHIIVRPTADHGLVKDRSGQVLYGLVDFELLERAPEREEALRTAKRQTYLQRQARRFETRAEFPPGLMPVTIMGVDYVYGQVESTGGALWVVGKDPVLFEYFLPEKWRRTPRTRLSAIHEVYETVTKDNVRLVWRVSRVGQRPDADPFVSHERRILAYGYNSPFEEFSLALELSRNGIETTYPRAIYMTGHQSTVPPALVDRSRYRSHAGLLTPTGHPILSEHHEYVLIWGYWNGPDQQLAMKDEAVYRGINALVAYRQGRLTLREYLRIMRTIRQRLKSVGIEDLNLRGNHLLFSVDKSDRLALDADGLPVMRICNFELLRRLGPRGARGEASPRPAGV